MAREPEEVQPEVYYIPGNYEEAGGLFGGKMQTRNFVELCAICGPIAFLEYKLLHFTLQTNIIIFCVTLIPLAALCVFGIGGESLSQIFIAFLRFHRNRRQLHYDTFTVRTESGKRAFNIDKFLARVSAEGFSRTVKMMRKEAQMERDAKEGHGQASKKTRRKSKPLKTSQRSHRRSRAEIQSDEDIELKQALNRQEKALKGHTGGWVESAEKDQSTDDMSRGRKRN